MWLAIARPFFQLIREDNTSAMDMVVSGWRRVVSPRKDRTSSQLCGDAVGSTSMSFWRSTDR
ncbi:hypothetical protein CP971_33800 [Streptomyces viridifaciens]|nr:hypothetical protein CP971_33800 [Streptomyces viridifaciens]